MGITEAIVSSIDASPRDMGAYRDLCAVLSGDASDGRREADPSGFHADAQAAIGAVTRGLRGGWATASGLEFLGGVLRELLTLDATLSLDSFMQAMEFDRSPESRLWLPRRSKLWRLCQELQRFECDPASEFLSVSMPPRTAKSSTCCMAMAWHMGRDPMHSNLAVAHSDKLTEHFYKQVLEFVSDPTYRFEEIFPSSKLVDQSAENESLSLRKRRAYPSLTCRSVLGTLTGAVEVGEGGWLYADDLVKDLEEAMSPTRLDKKWEAYVNQCYDRRKKGAKQLMVGTRWDVNDPIGRMARLHEGEPGYRTLTIPALDPDTGESNFDYLFGVGFDRSYYLDMRRTTDPATYAAKYDGSPIVREGQLFPPDQLERYLTLPDGEPERVVAVVDTKGVGSDYCAMPVARKWAGNPKWYVTDAVCDNSAPAVVNARVATELARCGVQVARFESNSAGGTVADSIAERLVEMGALCSVQKKYTMSNKETRILAASPWVIQNCVFRDVSLYQPGSDYARFMTQLEGFVLDGKNPHDDAPDAMSMLADLLTKQVRPKARAVRRPF